MYVFSYRGALSNINIIVGAAEWDNFTYEHLTHLAGRFEEATAFVKTWYLQYKEWTYTRITHHVIDASAQGLFSTPPAMNRATALRPYPGIAAHEVAHIIDLDNPDRFTFAQTSGIAADFNESNPLYNPYLNSYGLAGGFVKYLIEAYGAEKYLQVHWNVREFEAVYGITLAEMVARWISSLRV